MNCKHCEVRGNTTKYFWCRLKDKSVDYYSCRDCPLKINKIPNEVEELFGSFKRK